MQSEDGTCSIGHGNHFPDLASFLTQLDKKQLNLRHENSDQKTVHIMLQFPLVYDPTETMVKKPVPVSFVFIIRSSQEIILSVSFLFFRETEVGFFSFY